MSILGLVCVRPRTENKMIKNNAHHHTCFELHFLPSLEHTVWFIIACMTTKTIEVSDMVSLQCNFFCAVKPQKNHMI